MASNHGGGNALAIPLLADETVPALEWIAPGKLRPHPKNAEIYGTNESIDALIDLITRSGWIEPLIVTTGNRIISGHRRWRAAQALEREVIPIERHAYADELAEVTAILLYNADREKTVETRTREAQQFEAIERERARRRQIAAQNNDAARSVVANLPQLGEPGKSRDKAAASVGMKPRTFTKAKSVTLTIDSLRDAGKEDQAQALTKTLNTESVDVAQKVASSPAMEKVLTKLVRGEAKTAKQALSLVKQERPNTDDNGLFRENKDLQQAQLQADFAAALAHHQRHMLVLLPSALAAAWDQKERRIALEYFARAREWMDSVEAALTESPFVLLQGGRQR